MLVFQSVFLNDTLDHDTRDQKKVKKLGKYSRTAMKDSYLCIVI